MKNILYPYTPISALLGSVALFMLGNGPLPTLLSSELSKNDYSTWVIGLVMSQYYFGFVIGSFLGIKIISSVGHIRAFATFVSIISAITLIHAFIINPWLWGFFRFIVGICAIGMFMCSESWLNSIANNNNRGQFFSVYTILIYLFSGLGQLLLLISDQNLFKIYAIFSIFMSLAIIPVALTKNNPPKLNIIYFSAFKIWKISPTGVTSSLLAGVIGGSFYSIGPVYAQRLGYDIETIAFIIGIVTLGGLVLQYPVGKLSDGKDRRKFLIVVNLLLGLTCLLISLNFGSLVVFFALLASFGGLLTAIYPLAVSYTNDYLKPEELVSASGTLVLAYGIGAAIGPIFSSFTMTIFGQNSLFIFFTVITVMSSLFIFWRTLIRDTLPIEEQSTFYPIPKTSSVISNIDPRGEN